MKENQKFNFVTDSFQLEEAIIKGEKKFYVEGFISTTDEDQQGEIITSEAQDDMLAQLMDREITLDLEHEEWYDEQGKVLPRPKNQLIPVAKIIKAERCTSPKNGVWVKAELNQNLGGKFKSVWGSIKDGFLKAFSIAFYPVEAVSKMVNGKIKTLVSKLNLINITLTGSPVNTNATFVPCMKASLNSFKNQEVNEMSENENQPVESKPAEQEKPAAEEPKEQKAEEATPKVDNPSNSVEVPSPAVEVGIGNMQTPAFNAMPLDMIKAYKAEVDGLKSGLDEANAKIKAQEETIGKLKAELDKPIFKGTVEKEQPIIKSVVKNPLDYVK